MLPATVIRLATGFDNIIAVKVAVGDIVQAMRLVQNATTDFFVISGDDMIQVAMRFDG